MEQSTVNEKAMDQAVEETDSDFMGTKSTGEDKVHMLRLGKKQELIVCSALS